MTSFHSLGLTLRHHVWSRTGLAALSGLVLAGLAVLAWLLAIPALTTDAERLGQASTRLRQQVERTRLTRHATPAVGEQIRQFKAWFPLVDRNAADLRLLYTHAASAGVAIDKGEYQLASASAKGLVNYEVVLPVKARYANMREFIAAVLNAAPHASLAELRMERASASSDLLDARVHFTFVYQGE